VPAERKEVDAVGARCWGQQGGAGIQREKKMIRRKEKRIGDYVQPLCR